MTAIMPIDEPRPRGTCMGTRADARPVREADHYFRCKICGGFIDARDLAWVEDHEGPLPQPCAMAAFTAKPYSSQLPGASRNCLLMTATDRRPA